MQTEENFRILKMQILRRLQCGLQLAEAHFNQPFSMPQINYELKGSKAGLAYLQENTIKFNRTLLLENTEEFIHQVVLHELAHLVVYQHYGRVQPHGKEWQFVMTEIFHLPAEVCHQFDLTSVQGKTFAYRCACQTHQLSIRRHNKIQRDGTVYFCRKCKTRLNWVV
ncbi:SprT family zinc-dependent metalloprotease [Aggregatibacter actinomycetemcomitans]|uniref:SprT family zinc-dependent metalloprotease n=1 Tax=Aggregatibacter actinomycetemcomitans TaxID=714 RepID=UPI00197C856E|nr:SprT family zinc-dependent metalloprotease [Aggregatibacter actinomycetemcomitans]MBN6080186.1 SprT family zinc-dependent metalloprotease [Aggregatibacter actinomycetemcomitans]